MAVNDLSAQRLRELLHYNPQTGEFVWLVKRTGRALAGAPAGSKVRSPDGYTCLAIYVLGRPYKAHRLAWLYMTGEWPRHHIDHLDTNGLNNRFDNLREADNTINAQNRRRAHKQSSSGVLGVSPSGNRWRALIRVNGKRISLGSFATKEEAYAAYVEGKAALHAGNTL